MSEYIEIAYAAATHRLCFLTGTGFSKAVSDDKAPSWQSLLEQLCGLLKDGDSLKEELFPDGKAKDLSLEEAAQVIALKFILSGKNIYQEIEKIIASIELDPSIEYIQDFFKENTFKVITTNYDKLAEKLAGENRTCTITPGLPIPKYNCEVKVYHVHGSIDSPSDMVVTSEDYFRFINGNSYFSNKLSTILHENTIVILGYSLSDANLKAIINEYKVFSRDNVMSSNIFLISRGKLLQPIKDYYFSCFGIRVIDKTEVSDFFRKLNKKIPEAKKIKDKLRHSIKSVIKNGREYKIEFLKLEDSFYHIISSISSSGYSWNDEKVLNVFCDIIDKKIDLTKESGAWEQYEHLAKWLIYFGSLFEVKGTNFEKKYIHAVEHSMTYMNKPYETGYSWRAYLAWKTKWPSLTASNRSLIKSKMEEIPLQQIHDIISKFI